MGRAYNKNDSVRVCGCVCERVHVRACVLHGTNCAWDVHMITNDRVCVCVWVCACVCACVLHGTKCAWDVHKNTNDRFDEPFACMHALTLLPGLAA